MVEKSVISKLWFLRCLQVQSRQTLGTSSLIIRRQSVTRRPSFRRRKCLQHFCWNGCVDTLPVVLAVHFKVMPRKMPTCFTIILRLSPNWKQFFCFIHLLPKKWRQIHSLREFDEQNRKKSQRSYKIPKHFTCYLQRWWSYTLIETFVHSLIHSSIHSKTVLHRVRPSASSFNSQYPLISLRSSSSWLRLLCVLIISILSTKDIDIDKPVLSENILPCSEPQQNTTL